MLTACSSTPRGRRGPWQTAFSRRFGVDAGAGGRDFFATAWPKVLTGHRSVTSTLGSALDELGWDMGVEAALQCWFEEDFVVDPEVMDAVSDWSARGIPVALVSNQGAPEDPGSSNTTWPRCCRYRDLPFSGDLGVVKREADFYARAEHRLGVVGRGTGIVFVDDTLDNVEVATRHGWTGIHFRRDRNWREEVAKALGDAHEGDRPEAYSSLFGPPHGLGAESEASVDKTSQQTPRHDDLTTTGPLPPQCQKQLEADHVRPTGPESGKRRRKPRSMKGSRQR